MCSLIARRFSHLTHGQRVLFKARYLANSRAPIFLLSDTAMSKSFTLNTGAKIPAIGFGTGTALYNKDATKLVQLALETGITHLDGAQVYNNEDTLGAGIKASGKPRSELFVTTKLHVLSPGQTVKESLKASLVKLDLEYVDLFLIHDPTKAGGDLAKWWAGLEEVYRDGLAKAIGVSNFKVEDLKVVLESGTVVPAANQIEFHPYVWKAAEPIVKLCQERGIIIESYGGLTPIVRAPGGPLDPVIASVLERLKKTSGVSVSAGQVLTKWIFQKGAVAVTTSTKAERIQEFLSVENLPDLTAEEIDAIEEAGSKLHKRVFMRHAFGE
ncbi:NADP-dependent oxidoreductase domain-containing protein [Pholiota molesta]|nr:NADP-dependent oxidoreductase domain-containing protein [Pholiota molesta]